MSQQPIPIKLVVVGDGSVGKTCLLISYTQDKFPTQYVPTVFDNYAATVKVDNMMVNLGLWYIISYAGTQLDRNSITDYVLWLTHIVMFFLLFSQLSNLLPLSMLEKRYSDLQLQWYPQLQENVGNVPKIFVGNKIDLRDEYALMKKDPKQAPIMKETAQKIIEQQFQCKYMECSALTQQGLKNIFDQAMRIVLKSKAKPMVKRKKESSCNLI